MISHSRNGSSSTISILQEIKTKAPILVQDRKYKHSIPDWLDQMGVEAFGEELWEKEIAALNTPANLMVRVNTLVTSVQKLKDILEKKYNINTRTCS